MTSTFILPSIVAREALMILENNLVATNLANRSFAREWTGAKKGETITIRKPASFTVDEFTSTTSAQDVVETSTTLQLEKIFDTTVQITSKEMTLSLEDFSMQVVEPVMVAMAQKVDDYVLSKYVEVNEITGDGNLNAVSDLAGVNRKLQEMKVPSANRQGLLGNATEEKYLSTTDLYQAYVRGQGAIDTLTNARLGRVMGIDFYSSQNVPTHTAGVPGGSAVGSASAGATTVTVASGGAAGTFLKGDIITFNGLTGNYVVTANSTLNGSGAGSISIYPALTATISSAAITVTATHQANLVGNFKGLSLASVPLDLPINDARVASRMDSNGLSIRVVYDYNSSTKTNTISFDMLAGAKVTDPRMLTRFRAN